MIKLDSYKIHKIIAEKYNVPFENVTFKYDYDDMYGVTTVWANVKTVWESQSEEEFKRNPLKSNFATDKQIKYCKSIRNALDLPVEDKEFEKMTKYQASQFIQENKKEYDKIDNNWGEHDAYFIQDDFAIGFEDCM